MKETPLVSVIVITYQSAATVLETLDSIYAQTYACIELVVADDGSGDHTMDLVKEWVITHGQRFEGVTCTIAPQNQGIPANCNRGVKHSRGKFIKIIAGDDLLTRDCIAYFVSHADGQDLLCSAMDGLKDGKLVPMDPTHERDLAAFFRSSPSHQLRNYVRNPIFLNTPTWFYARTAYDQVDGFDESISLLEDQPFLIKLLAAGYTLTLLPAVTVHYRISTGSTMGGQKLPFRLCLLKCFRTYRLPYLRWTSIPEVLIRLEFMVLKGLLKPKRFRPERIDRFQRYRPSRVLLEPGFGAHFIRKAGLMRTKAVKPN